MPQPGPCPWAQLEEARGKWPDWQAPDTLTWLWSALLPSPPEYKKKYGEEHGSCQAGIAGFFTEVGVSHVAFVSLSFLLFGPFHFVVGVAPGDGISEPLGSVDSAVSSRGRYLRLPKDTS